MTTPTPVPAGSIVVGIDGSPGSDRALDWAARQAELEHRPLTLAHSAHLSAGGETFGFVMNGADLADEAALIGRVLLDGADRRAHQLVPDLPIHHSLRTDVDARHMLVELAEHAASLAVGSRGRGSIASALLGSVSVGLTKHATCPVAVIRRDSDATAGGGVMVEVSEGSSSHAAVEHAYRTAALRGWSVTVVQPVWVPGHLGARTGDVGPDVPGLEEARAAVAAVTTSMAVDFPEVTARVRLVNGVREHVLVLASQDADLLVLSSRRLSSLDDMLQCSSVATVVEHARCDVVVVPTGLRHSDDSDRVAGDTVGTR